MPRAVHRRVVVVRQHRTPVTTFVSTLPICHLARPTTGPPGLPFTARTSEGCRAPAHRRTRPDGTPARHPCSVRSTPETTRKAATGQGSRRERVRATGRRSLRSPTRWPRSRRPVSCRCPPRGPAAERRRLRRRWRPHKRQDHDAEVVDHAVVTAEISSSSPRSRSRRSCSAAIWLCREPIWAWNCCTTSSTSCCEPHP